MSVIRTSKATEPKATAAKATGFGAATVKVKGAKANATQRNVLGTILAVCVDLKAPNDVAVMAVMCVTQESVAGIDHQGGLGPFHRLQKTVGTAGDTRDWLKGTGGDFHEGGALNAYRKHHGKMTLSRIINLVQRSAFPDAYQQWKDEAEDTVAAYRGGGGLSFGDGGSIEQTIKKRYEFTRGERGGKHEDSWDAAGRLSEEVQWSRWAAGNAFYYVSQDELIAGPPGVELDGTEGYILDAPQWRWGSGRAIAELTFHVLSERWAIMPGGVVVWDADAPYDGRWIVATVSGESLESPVMEVALKRPTHKKAEPAPETETKTVGGGDSPDVAAGDKITSAGGARGMVEQAFKIAHTVASEITVVSDYRPGSTTTSGNVSDHSQNNASRAARDIGQKGVNALTGPPTHKLDKACVLVGAAFGRHYREGQTVDADTFGYRGFRVQIIWRTPKYGGHMGHIHCGARRGGA